MQVYSKLGNYHFSSSQQGKPGAFQLGSETFHQMSFGLSKGLHNVNHSKFVGPYLYTGFTLWIKHVFALACFAQSEMYEETYWPQVAIHLPKLERRSVKAVNKTKYTKKRHDHQVVEYIHEFLRLPVYFPEV